MLLQRFFSLSSSFESFLFSRLSLSFSSTRSDEPPAESDGVVGGGDEFDERTCSPPEFEGDALRFAGTATVIGGPIITGVATAAAAGEILRRWISRKSRLSPRRNESFENSHRSGTIFLNPYRKINNRIRNQKSSSHLQLKEKILEKKEGKKKEEEELA